MPKYDEYPEASPLTGTETVVVVQDGETKKVPVSELAGTGSQATMDPRLGWVLWGV